jgi:hypothetical protein
MVAAVQFGNVGCGFRHLVGGGSHEDLREALARSHAPHLVQSPARHQVRGSGCSSASELSWSC